LQAIEALFEGELNKKSGICRFSFLVARFLTVMKTLYL
jgi:hypothetical protein